MSVRIYATKEKELRVFNVLYTGHLQNSWEAKQNKGHWGTQMSATTKSPSLPWAGKRNPNPQNGSMCRTSGHRLCERGGDPAFVLFPHLVPTDLRSWEIRGSVISAPPLTVQDRVGDSQEGCADPRVWNLPQILTTWLCYPHYPWFLRPLTSQTEMHPKSSD